MSRCNRLEDLRGHGRLVLPSLLLCDFGNLEREVARLTAAGVRGLHLDVMDGNFVPNLTYGLPIVAALRRLTDLPLDVHLMIREPQRHVAAFRDAGADVLTVHVEAVDDPRAVLEQIRATGAVAGMALNPATPLDRLEPCFAACDLLLVMSVPAGFGGQSFQEVALEKLAALRRCVAPDVWLEIDGGVNRSTIARCARAGADLMVVGSAIFGNDDYAGAVQELTALAQVS